MLECRGDELLLLSDYALDCLPFNRVSRECAWQNCSLRKWLNGTFTEEAFSEPEKEQLLETRFYGKESEPDLVFLLSQREIQQYIPNESERVTAPTAYAVRHGAWTNRHGSCYFWVRCNTGGKDHKARYVTTAGDFADYACSSRTRCVRPALWMKFRQQ